MNFFYFLILELDSVEIMEQNTTKCKLEGLSEGTCL